MTEHLVTPTGDRLLGEREHAREHVPHRIVTGHLLGAGAVETAGSVVEQRRVGRPERRRDRRVALVSGRADRVIAVALRTEPSRRVVDDPALHLRREDAVEHADVGRRVRAGHSTGGGADRGDAVEQCVFQFVEVVRTGGHGRMVRPT